jgi:hypothetical protein
MIVKPQLFHSPVVLIKGFLVVRGEIGEGERPGLFHSSVRSSKINQISEKSQFPRQAVRKRHPLWLILLLVIMGQFGE